jgi:hypothetical protein
MEKAKLRETPALGVRIGFVLAVAVSPDGRTLALTDGTDLSWWEVGTWQKLGGRSLPIKITRLAFAPDSRHLATANLNGTVYILRLDPPL